VSTKRTSRTRPTAAAKRAASRESDPSKSIAVSVDPDMRARAEKVWIAHNKVQPVPATKSAIYRSALDNGLKLWERELGIIAS
jgi:hypothetical protein